MKKENRRMAQQARAEERRKQERNRKIKKFLSYFIPLAVILILIGILAADSLSNSQSTTSDGSASTETETDSTESESTEDTSDSQTASYSADTSLTVEDGDTVNIDYVGTVDGVEFDGGNTNGQGTDLVIGSGSYIDDFEEQLIGAHPGDDVQVEVTFPDDYSNADLQGKDAVFAVTINGIYE